MIVPLFIGLVYGIGLVVGLVVLIVWGVHLGWFWWIWGIVAVVWSYYDYHRLKDFNQWGQ